MWLSRNDLEAADGFGVWGAGCREKALSCGFWNDLEVVGGRLGARKHLDQGKPRLDIHWDLLTVLELHVTVVGEEEAQDAALDEGKAADAQRTGEDGQPAKPGVFVYLCVCVCVCTRVYVNYIVCKLLKNQHLSMME